MRLLPFTFHVSRRSSSRRSPRGRRLRAERLDEPLRRPAAPSSASSRTPSSRDALKRFPGAKIVRRLPHMKTVEVELPGTRRGPARPARDRLRAPAARSARPRPSRRSPPVPAGAPLRVAVRRDAGERGARGRPARRERDQDRRRRHRARRHAPRHRREEPRDLGHRPPAHERRRPRRPRDVRLRARRRLGHERRGHRRIRRRRAAPDGQGGRRR